MKKGLVALTLTLLFSLNAKAESYSAQSFEKLQQQGKNILVHVHADWCPTCILQQKRLKKVDLKGAALITVDFDKDSEFRKIHNAKSQSLFIAFNGKKEVARIGNITSQKAIQAFVDQNLTKETSDTSAPSKKPVSN